MSLNRVFLMGNLTRDPEVRATANNQTVTKFGVACNRKWVKDGQTQEEVTFVDCEAWGKAAENIGRFFTKGKPILVEGRLRLDQWDAKDGTKRSKLLVVVDTFTFVGGPKDDAQPTTARREKPPHSQGTYLDPSDEEPPTWRDDEPAF